MKIMDALTAVLYVAGLGKLKSEHISKISIMYFSTRYPFHITIPSSHLTGPHIVTKWL